MILFTKTFKNELPKRPFFLFAKEYVLYCECVEWNNTYKISINCGDDNIRYCYGNEDSRWCYPEELEQLL